MTKSTFPLALALRCANQNCIVSRSFSTMTELVQFAAVHGWTSVRDSNGCIRWFCKLHPVETKPSLLDDR